MDTASLIRSFRISERGVSVSVSTHLRPYVLDDHTVTYDAPLDLREIDPTICLIPFLLNLAPVVWLAGGRYSVETMDAALAAALPRLKLGYERMYPRTKWPGEIVAERLVTSAPRGSAPREDKRPRVAVLFSGGVDSTFTSLRHREEAQTLLAFQGNDIALGNAAGWDRFRSRCLEFAHTYGHEMAFAVSNSRTFLSNDRVCALLSGIRQAWWGRVQHGPSLIGMAAPVAHALGCHKLYIAASDTKEYAGPSGSHPSLDNTISWSGTTVEHDGFDHSRQAKLTYLAELCRDGAIPRPILQVCYAHPYSTGGNCCRCEKCLRTILGLILEGEDARAYGFAIPPEEGMVRIREEFTRAKQLGDRVALEGVRLLWRQLQARAAEIVRTGLPGQADAQDGAFVEWFANLDMDAYLADSERLHHRFSLGRFAKDTVKRALTPMPRLKRKVTELVTRSLR